MSSNQNRVSPILSDKSRAKEGGENQIQSRANPMTPTETKGKKLNNALVSLSRKLDELEQANERFFRMINLEEKETSSSDVSKDEDSLFQNPLPEAPSNPRLVYQLSSLMGLLIPALDFSHWGVFLLNGDVSDPADPDADMEEVSSSCRFGTDEFSEYFRNEVKAQYACGNITQVISMQKRTAFPTERGSLLVVPLELSNGKDGFWVMQFEKGISVPSDIGGELLLWGTEMVITCMENTYRNRTLVPPPVALTWQLEGERVFTLSELSRAVIHEINNSLQIIQGRAQIVRMKQSKSHEVSINSGIWETIEKNANQIGAILKNFSDFLHRQVNGAKALFPQTPERNRGISIKEVNLQHILESNLALLQYILGSCGIELELKKGDSLPTAGGEPDVWELAFLSSIWGIKENLPAGGRIVVNTSSDQESICLNLAWTGKEGERGKLPRGNDISDNARFKLVSQILKKYNRELKLERKAEGEGKITLNIPIARNKI